MTTATRVRPSSPRDVANRLEAAPRLAASDWDRFAGYGVLGIGFGSGQILAMRRFTASSIGSAFSSVWRRDAAGRWSFYVDAEPDLTCGRYFGTAGAVMRAEIDVTWQGHTSFSVQVPAAGLAWAIHLVPTLGTRALGAVRRRLPPRIRRHPAVRRAVAAAASHVLQVDNLAMAGRAPSGHRFELDADRFWIVDASSAREHGAHLGPPTVLRAPVRLGDFTIPAWGIFTTGDALFEKKAQPDQQEVSR